MMDTTPTTLDARFRAHWSGWRERGPGILICVTVAAAAQLLARHYGAPQMLFALLLGMAFHFLAEEGPCVTGIEFSAKTVLRFGVALLGLRITVEQVLDLGLDTVALLAGGVVSTILFGIGASKLLGRRIRFGTLTGGAVAICGASAALAIAAILPKSEHGERDTIFTVIAVTTFSTVAMVLYPLIAGFMGLEDRISGIFLGGTIHDVAQVVGAGYTISEETGDIATVTTLFRVSMLVQVVLVLSMVFHSENKSAGRAPLPLFIVGFCALVALNSSGMVPGAVHVLLVDLSRWCLVTAIGALGIKTSLKAMMTIGYQPVAVVLMESVFIAVWVLGGTWLLN
ncbi:MAG: putative sulfate exporter family transporter [Alphaproteobacteria bacterium]|nr:putative sulfate exporter family transporter [Alphaproteobacteria bacterium]